MTRIYSITLALFLLSTNTLKAQFGNIEFVENKGQWDTRVKYRGLVPAGAFFIRPTGFTILQQNADDIKAMQDAVHGHVNNTSSRKEFVTRSHSYNVDFIGASTNIELVPDKSLNTYNNYFLGNDPSKWASNCKIYQAVTMKDVYPNVDVRYYTEGGSMKYDIVLKPGADPSKIALRYVGANKLEVKNKQLVVSTSVGDVKEMDPYTYQFDNNKRVQVTAKYVVKGNEVRFDLKDYDATKTLIIDPTWIFTSFSGATGSNWGFTATYGPDGAFYGGGISIDNLGFPTSPGAFQTVWGGGSGTPPCDISIIKLDPNGTNRMYATYVGGQLNDQPHSLVVDGAGNLVICGRSNSGNYPVRGIGQIGTGGSYDIVVTKLNALGTDLIGSLKIGGSVDDGVNIRPNRIGSISTQQNYGDDGRSEVILDGSGNIYVASCTQSSDFPTSPGALQATNGGAQDGVVLKFNPTLSARLFSTYLGGSGDDAAYVLALSPTNEIYVGGGTASANFPGITPGTIGPSYQGGIDGFVAILTNAGTAVTRSTYLGTPQIDQVFGVQFDRFGFPYVMGQTRGNWPVINATYSNAGAPQFIAKLEPDLSAYVYSTRFGRAASTPNISPIAFLVDICENVYVSGWGGDVERPNNPFQSSGTMNMPITSDALQSAQDGADMYFFVLEKNAASQLYGTFYGVTNVNAYPDHVDGGTSRFDRQGTIYQAVCANCGAAGNFPTGPGIVWSPNNGAAAIGGCNLGMIKIRFDFAGVESGVQSSIGGVPRDTAGCVPLTVDFTDTLALGVTYYWNFGDGGLDTTTTPNTSHTFTSTGTFNVMLITEDSTTCNIRDTSYIHIRVGDLQAFLDFNAVKLLPCEELRFRFDNLSVAPPSRPFTDTSFVWTFGDGSAPLIAGTAPVFHNYSAPGSYIVTLTLRDTAYCNYPQTIADTINISPQVVAQFETPPAGCVPYNANFNNTSIAGQTFIWDFGDGSPTSNVEHPSHLYNVAGSYVVTLIAIDSNTCNISDTTTFTITVQNNPVANWTHAPVVPIENTPTTFTNLSSPDAINFIWLFGDGDSLLTSSRAPVIHQYNATGTFNACLIAINAAGCRDTLCAPVEALVVPAVDVPNAFTPASGDINSRVFVRGYGITKMRFIIWNRWGQKVFETNSQAIGWDGKLKGVIQPMDVYAYTLDVEFFDGTKATKKGDLTLIR